jgi:uncharacterized phiE125 gp8 family phage protein
LAEAWPFLLNRKLKNPKRKGLKMPLTIQTTVPPAAEPLNLTEVKNHLRVEAAVTADDNLITALLTAAREYCEDFLNRALVTQTKRLTLDAFPAAVIELPAPPVVSVSSITYIDTAGSTQTWTSSLYKVDEKSEPARVTPAFGEIFPSTRREINAVAVTYLCGSLTPFTAATSDIITSLGRAFEAEDVVRFINSGGALPAGLSAGTDYYVRDVSGSTFKVELSVGGGAVDITDTGSGTNYIETHPPGGLSIKIKAAILLIVGHLYEHREEVSEINLNEVPMAARSLLWSERVF